MLAELDPRIFDFTVFAVLGRWDELAALRRGLAAPPGRPWREALLQAHLFAGFPRIVEAFGVLEAAGGLGIAEPDEVLGEPDNPARGQALFAQVYGARTAAVENTLLGHHPDFAGWIFGHAYGRVLSRPGLPAFQRELLAVAALIALGQDRQLASHARGAVALGASPTAVRGVLERITPLVPEPAVASARRVLERFAPL